MTNRTGSPKAQEQALLQKLLQVPIFARLSGQYLQLLLKVAKPKALKQGESVWRPGEASKGLYLLLKGQVKILAEDQREQLLNPIAVLGEINTLVAQPYTDQAVTVENSVLLEISRPHFEQLLIANSNVCQILCRNIINSISDKLQAANERIAKAQGERQGLELRIKDADAELNALRIIKLR